jgi:hypothetical protein
MRSLILVCLFVVNYLVATGQGYNSTWLIGYENWVTKAIMTFDSNNYLLTTGPRSIGFEGTEATISDEQGNLLISSNGTWIANANHDTMMNGSGLNPSVFTNAYPDGLLLPYANIILPWPGDSTKYALFHHSATFDGSSYPTFEVLYSTIDITLDNGLGGVISKNDTVFQDTLNWGLAACKHANGRDWWIVSQKQSSDVIFTMLLTPTGIESVFSQILNVPIARYNVTQLTFSKDGTKFSYCRYEPGTMMSTMQILDFDRCTGIFSNPQVIPLTSNSYVYGLAFSSNGEYVYSCSSNYIFQVNVSTLIVDTVAIYDGFCFPNPPWCTSFFNLYLAANGKIYITSGSGVQHIHEMNYPDSAGVSCDVQQHAIYLGIWSFRAVPNHPNYYLGAADGTVCDSLGLNNINEDSELQQYFRIYPNPTNGSFSISYLLTENTPGFFEIYNINGKQIFVETLPPWSNFQAFDISNLASGIYNCIITSGKNRVFKKLIIQNK